MLKGMGCLPILLPVCTELTHPVPVLPVCKLSPSIYFFPLSMLEHAEFAYKLILFTLMEGLTRLCCYPAVHQCFCFCLPALFVLFPDSVSLHVSPVFPLCFSSVFNVH